MKVYFIRFKFHSVASQPRASDSPHTPIAVTPRHVDPLDLIALGGLGSARTGRDVLVAGLIQGSG